MSAAVLDKALDAQLTDLFLEGASVNEARYLVFALKWFTGLGPERLPLAAVALKGFANLCPGGTREPATWEATVLIAAALVEMPSYQALLAGVGVLLQFDTYARPSELLSLQVSWTVPGLNLVTFYPATQAARSKTGQQGDSVVIGVRPQRRWLRKVFQALVAQAPRDGTLLQIDLASYENFFHAGATRAGLAHLRLVPHCLRHGGASVDDLNKVPEGDIQTRGRWKARGSLLRYKKHGRYLRQVALLTAAQRHAAQAAAVRLARTLPALLRQRPARPHGPAPSRKRPLRA